jgi:tripartite-type tricarboxylate transporter receptor subunit TctC
LFVPAGTPKEVVARIAADTLEALGRPDVRQKLAGLGFEVDPLGPEPFARYQREQIAYWGKLVRDAGIQPE